MEGYMSNKAPIENDAYQQRIRGFEWGLMMVPYDQKAYKGGVAPAASKVKIVDEVVQRGLHIF